MVSLVHILSRLKMFATLGLRGANSRNILLQRDEGFIL
jgi:hypothetical protein